MSGRHGCSCCGDCSALSATHQEERPRGPTISSFPYEGMWELWTDHQARRLHGSVRPGGGTDKGRIDVAAMGGKARKPLLTAAKPRVQLCSHPRQPHARGNGSKCGGHRGTRAPCHPLAPRPHANHWPGLLFVSPAPLSWQLTEASLALRGDCGLKKRAGLRSQEAHA